MTWSSLCLTHLDVYEIWLGHRHFYIRYNSQILGAVYNYYKSKEEILAAITRQAQKDKRDILDRLKECKNAMESFQKLFELFFNIYKSASFRTYGSIDLETYCEATRNNVVRIIMQEEFKTLSEPLINLIKYWQRKNEIRKDIDPNYMANLIISLSIGIKIHLLLQQELTVDGFEEIIRKTFFESLWYEHKAVHRK